MVQSTASTVDAFMAEVSPERLPALEQLRATIRDVLVGYEEQMSYGMPSYYRDGELVLAFNNQKQYIAFYAGGAAVTKFADRLAGIDCGKGCIRYRKPGAIDFEVVRAILEDIRERREAMC